MTQSPNVQYTQLETNTANNEIRVNEALNRFDALVYKIVQSLTVTDPATLTPQDGQVWVVGVGAVGVWAGQDKNLAIYSAGWQFLPPQQGWLVYDLDNAFAHRQYIGTEWESVSGGSTGLGWEFSTDVALADPTAGKLKFNNADPSLATAIYVSATDSEGVDLSAILAAMTEGTKIYVKQGDAPAKHGIYEVVSLVDQTGWFTINVTNDSAGALPDDESDLSVAVFGFGSGGGGGGGGGGSGEVGFNQTMWVKQVLTPGSDGGTSNAGDQVREFNTVEGLIVGASLSADQIKLPPGKYRAQGSAPCYDGARHKIVLYDTTSLSVLVEGADAYTAAIANSQSIAVLDGPFTLNQESILELRHNIEQTAFPGLGLGVGNNNGYDCVFAQIKFTKIGAVVEGTDIVEKRVGGPYDWVSGTLDVPIPTDQGRVKVIVQCGVLASDDYIDLTISEDGTTFKNTGYTWDAISDSGSTTSDPDSENDAVSFKIPHNNPSRDLRLTHNDLVFEIWKNEAGTHSFQYRVEGSGGNDNANVMWTNAGNYEPALVGPITTLRFESSNGSGFDYLTAEVWAEGPVDEGVKIAGNDTTEAVQNPSDAAHGKTMIWNKDKQAFDMATTVSGSLDTYYGELTTDQDTIAGNYWLLTKQTGTIDADGVDGIVLEANETYILQAKAHVEVISGAHIYQLEAGGVLIGQEAVAYSSNFATVHGEGGTISFPYTVGATNETLKVRIGNTNACDLIAAYTNVSAIKISNIYSTNSILNMDAASKTAFLTADDSPTLVTADQTNLAIAAEQTLIDITSGGAELVESSITGIGAVLRVTVDGVVILDEFTPAIVVGTGDDGAGDLITQRSLPAIFARDSLKIEIKNLSGASADYGWVLWHRPVSNQTPQAVIPDIVRRYSHVEASGIGGGASVAGSWLIRSLNTESGDTLAGASLSANVISLLAGTYRFKFAGAFFRSDGCMNRLYNITDAVVVGYGEADLSADVTRYSHAWSRGDVREVTFATDVDLRLEYRVFASHAAGLGSATTFGVDNIYGWVDVTKVGTQYTTGPYLGTGDETGAGHTAALADHDKTIKVDNTLVIPSGLPEGWQGTYVNTDVGNQALDVSALTSTFGDSGANIGAGKKVTITILDAAGTEALLEGDLV